MKGGCAVDPRKACEFTLSQGKGKPKACAVCGQDAPRTRKGGAYRRGKALAVASAVSERSLRAFLCLLA